MTRGIPPPFPHADPAGGAPGPRSGQKKYPAGDGEEQALHGARRGQRAVEPPRVAAHDRADADEVQADRPEGRPGELRALQKQRAEAFHQDVGEARHQQAELVGVEGVAAGPPGEQVELLLLDPVLHPPARAIHVFIEMPPVAGKGGRDAAVVRPEAVVLRLGDHSAVRLPRPRAVHELAEQLRLRLQPREQRPRVLAQLRAERLQAAVPGDADDVVHAVAFAPAEHPVPAEAAVAAEDDAHARPLLPEARHEQLQDRPRVLRAVDLRAAQIRDQQPVAAEHVEGEEAVAVVVAVEEAPLLHPVDRVVRRVEVEHQLPRGLREAFDELLHHEFGKRYVEFARRAVLESAQRARQRKRAVAPDGGQQKRVLREPGLVVQVLVARRQAEDALAEHVGQMPDLAPLAGVEPVEHLACPPRQAEPPVQLPQQKEDAVAADGAAPEIKHDYPVLPSLKNYLYVVQFGR